MPPNALQPGSHKEIDILQRHYSFVDSIVLKQNLAMSLLTPFTSCQGKHSDVAMKWNADHFIQQLQFLSLKRWSNTDLSFSATWYQLRWNQPTTAGGASWLWRHIELLNLIENGRSYSCCIAVFLAFGMCRYDANF